MESESIQDKKLLQFRWILLFGLIHGLIYVFLMPPWQHYDEPNHFEVAWLVSQGNYQPEFGDVQPEFRRELLQSMIDHDFFYGMDYQPDINAQMPQIGVYTQLDDPRLYYWMLGTIFSFFSEQPVLFLLYLGRMFSLSLYLLTLYTGWIIMKTIAPSRISLRVTVPWFLVLVPGFVDLMTAINNEVLAVAITSLSLWGFVHILHNGLTWKNLPLTFIAVILAMFARSTLYLLIPVFVVVLLIGLFSETRTTKRIWVGVLVLIVVFILSITLMGDAALWLRGVDQNLLTRVNSPLSPHGEYAFQFDTHAKTTPRWIEPLSQSIPIELSRLLKGQTLHVGAWIWADIPQRTRTPLIRQGYDEWFELVEVTRTPKFYSYTVTTNKEGPRIWLALDPYLSDPSLGRIYYDGIVVTNQHVNDISQVPTFENKLGSSGYWDGTYFNNIARNPSAERGWLLIRPIVDEFGSRILPDDARPSFLLGVVQDFGTLDWFHSITAQRLIRTFWAKFGWGHVNLLGRKPYWIFAIITFLGLLGAAVWIPKDFKNFPRNSVVVFSLLILGFWLPNLSRGFVLIAADRLYFPVSRYNFPTIIPAAFFLTAGWLFILRSTKIPQKYHLWIYFIFFILVDIWSIISIWVFYNRRI